MNELQEFSKNVLQGISAELIQKLTDIMEQQPTEGRKNYFKRTIDEINKSIYIFEKGYITKLEAVKRIIQIYEDKLETYSNIMEKLAEKNKALSL